MEIICIILSISILLMCINNSRLYKINSSLKEELLKVKSEASKSKKDKEELVSIDPGDKAIIPDYGLYYKDENKSFKVTYEVDIIEVSIDKVKVSATSYTTSDAVAKDPKNKRGIIDFMQNKWVSKKEIDLVVDDAMRRDAKLQEILRD